MPARAKVPCRYPLCAALVAAGECYCPEHTQAKEAATRARIGSSTKRGYGYDWQKKSRAWLRKHPLCAECQRAGRVTAATIVDHIEPHRGDRAKFWNRDNWQGLCQICHGRKSAAERDWKGIGG